ncbi:MAG: ribosome small subunit-dependent GTPase A [Paludibacteraceae bacterium]|nr:ribosome small subunit-dependent GTPase A [Paludibacteraceae bacterium]
MNGLVIKNTGSWYLVRTDEQKNFECKIKGSFRLKGIRTTNPIAVGDRVVFDVDTEGFGLISEIQERKNYIVRKSSNLSKQAHIIAANLDQTYLVVTINYPETTTVFIDRFLATAEAYRVPAKLIFNKIDLYSAEELEYLDSLISLYSSIGYECLKVSSFTGEGIEELRESLKDKITLFSGHSGVGKSTLINSVEENLLAKTSEISEYHNKGMHTTTFSEMYELSKGGFLIDTPGIKGFGMVYMEEKEVSHYFPEIFAVSKDCRFGNCTHVQEPGCAVLEAVSNHWISQSRYLSYLNILEDLKGGKYR